MHARSFSLEKGRRALAPGELTSALEPILQTIALLTERIKDYAMAS
jgi:hypothetical protein